ncbi:hypothetical protein ABI004_15000, partial [Enterococcus faecium]
MERIDEAIANAQESNDIGMVLFLKQQRGMMSWVWANGGKYEGPTNAQLQSLLRFKFFGPEDMGGGMAFSLME